MASCAPTDSSCPPPCRRPRSKSTHIEIFTLAPEGLQVRCARGCSSGRRWQVIARVAAASLPPLQARSCWCILQSQRRPQSSAWYVLVLASSPLPAPEAACTRHSLTPSMLRASHTPLPRQSTLDIPVYGRISALRLFKPQVRLTAALKVCRCHRQSASAAAAAAAGSACRRAGAAFMLGAIRIAQRRSAAPSPPPPGLAHAAAVCADGALPLLCARL